MKKLLFITAVLVSIVSFGQKKEHSFTLKTAPSGIKYGVFSTKMENGIGVKMPISFKVIDIQEVKNTNVYKAFADGYVTDKNYQAECKALGLDVFGAFLLESTQISGVTVKYEFKNKASFTLIKDAEGSVYAMSPDEVVFSFPCQAQNGYGNMIYNTAYFSVKLVNNKLDYEALVSSK